MKIVINGLGVAGPALAYWLTKSGHDVVLVEKAASLRDAGFVIDFWGIGYDIVEKMGLIAEVRRLGYQVEHVRFVDERGRTRGGFNVDIFGRATNHRFTTVRRSDLSATMYHAIENNVETIFGDSVAGIVEYDGGVHVTFDHAPPRDFDLVIGADGLHSRVRQIAFGAEKDVEVSLGYHVAAIEAKGYHPRDELVFISHSLPGRQISRFSMRDDKTLFLFVFRDEYMSDGDPKSILNRAFADAGWEWPAISRELSNAGNIYFDTVSQIHMDRWTKGRTALVGDAAAAVSLMAGEGTGLAIAEAYILAGELSCCAGDYGLAFARYEQRLMPFIRRKQDSAAKFATSFAPKTKLGIRFRNQMTKLMRLNFVAEYFIGKDLKDDIELPGYGFDA